MNGKQAKAIRKANQLSRRQELGVALQVKAAVNSSGLKTRLYIAALIVAGRW